MNMHKILALEQELKLTNTRLEKVEKSLDTAFRLIQLLAKLDNPRHKEVQVAKSHDTLSTGRQG